MYTSMLYVLIICLVIGLSLSAANSTTDTNPFAQNNETSWTKLNLTELQCLTKRGEPGLCQEEELCNSLNKSETTSCSDGKNMCCPLSDNQTEETDEINSLPIPSVHCGVRPTKRKLGLIKGGRKTIANIYPWAAALYLNSEFICGATIINERWVLSAAHCIIVYSPENFQVKVGAHNLSDSGYFVEVESVIVHQLYDPEWSQNDISLLKLKHSLDFTNENIAPVCLPTKKMDQSGNVGQMCTIVGWGRLEEGGTPADTLMQVHVPIISNYDCIKSYNSRVITKKQLCAGYQEGGKDACQGDSGGSLCLKMDKRYYQMGIVSGGRGCGQPNSPGIYTRVSQFIDWISQNTRN